MTRAARSARRVLAALALGIVLGVPAGLQALPGTHPSPASAHATLVSTTPEHGSEVASAPSGVTVEFDEPVTFVGLSDPTAIIDASGSRVDAGPGTLDAGRTVLTIPLSPDVPEGVYIASWRVVSADTHPVGGSIQFGIGVPPGLATAPAAPEPSPWLTLAVGVVKGALYLGLVPAFGLLPASFVLGGGAREARALGRIAAGGAVLAALASLGQLGCQFLWLRSTAIESTAGDLRGELAEFLASDYARAIWVRLLLLCAAAVAVRARGRFERGRLIALLGLGLGVVCTVVVNGHGGAGTPWLFASTALHALGAIGWLGGLALLGRLLRRRGLTPERLLRLPRWSLYAAVCVGALTLSGILQSFDAVEFPPALLETRYGIMLIAKAALVGSALALGGWAFLWTRREIRRTTARGSAPPPETVARFRSRVRWEAGIAAAVVVLSGVLSSITPAKDEWAPVIVRTAEIGPYEVELLVAPARQGPQAFRIRVEPPADNWPQPSGIELTLSQLNGPVEQVSAEFPFRIPDARVPGEPTAETFVSAAVNVPASGRWEALVTLVVDRLTQYSGTVDYESR